MKHSTNNAMSQKRRDRTNLTRGRVLRQLLGMSRSDVSSIRTCETQTCSRTQKKLDERVYDEDVSRWSRTDSRGQVREDALNWSAKGRRSQMSSSRLQEFSTRGSRTDLWIRWTLTEDLAWRERYVVDLEDRAPSRAWDVWNRVQQIMSRSLFAPIQNRVHRDICRWSFSDRFVYVTFATGKRNWITGHEESFEHRNRQTTTRDLQIPSAHTFSSTSSKTNDNSRAFKDRSGTDAYQEE